MVLGRNEAINWNPMLAMISNKLCSIFPNGSVINRTDDASESIRAGEVFKDHRPMHCPNLRSTKTRGEPLKCRFPGLGFWVCVSGGLGRVPGIWRCHRPHLGSTDSIHSLPVKDSEMKAQQNEPTSPTSQSEWEAEQGSYITDVPSSKTVSRKWNREMNHILRLNLERWLNTSMSVSRSF